VNKFLKIKI